MIVNDIPYWFVICVKLNHEKQAASILSSMGVECYLPLRQEVHKWSDRKKVVDALVLPRYIFIHATNSVRQKVLSLVPPLVCSLMDRCSGEPAYVRDAELESFRAMVEKGPGPVSFSSEPLSPGDKVRVVSGPLAGCVCELVEVNGAKCLVSRLSILGCASVELTTETLKKI